MAVEIGALRALLSLDSAAFEKGAKRAQASMGNLQRGLSKTADRMKGIGRAMTTRMTAPIVAGTGLLVRSSIQTAVEIERLSQVANAGTGEFQRFAAGAKDAGIEQDKLADILKDTNDRIGDFAETGGGPMADFFENIAPKVGVTADQFARLSGPEALQLYVSSLEKAGASQQEMTFYMEAIASDATRLLPLLRDNGKEMERLGDRAAELGAVMDEKTIEALNNAHDSMRDLGQAGAGLSNRLTAALAPALEFLAEKMVEVSRWFSSLSPEMQRFTGVAAAVGAALGPIAIALGLMVTGLAAVLSPIGLVVAAVATLTVGLIKFWPEIMAAKEALIGFGRDGIEWIKEKFKGLIDFFRTLPEQMIQVGENLIEGLKDGILQKWKDVKSSVLGVGTSITDGFKGVFGIESPSKIFKEIGANLMVGLGIGVTEGEGLATGPLNNAADAMKGSMEGVGDSFDRTGDRFGDMVAGIITGSQSAADALKQIGSQLINSGISGIASSLFKGSGLGDLFAGFFDDGGMIPPGQFGIAGERGPEIVTGPARVTSRADTARMMGGGQAAQAQSLNVTVTMDESTGALGAFVRNESGRVVAQATPNIVRQSVGATYERAKEVALP